MNTTPSGTTPADSSAPTPMFPGQAAAPPGPCDLTGMYLMHHGFRRDLDRLVAAVAVTPPSERRTWKALARWWRDVAALLHEHHTKEDELLWPVLVDRADADGRAVLAAMEDEHDRIDPALAAVEDALAQLVAGTDAVAARDRATAAFTDLRTLLDEHLAHEERDAVALIQEHLSAAEWTRMEDDGLAHKPAPPLLFFLLPWIADGLTKADLAPLLSSAGAPVAVMMRASTPGYRRRFRRAFAHLPQGTGRTGGRGTSS
ncbi:hemerythrin domain-containing protein [Nocardioides sp. CFH 31398]|uniref:hemerythrin domain-containing protein n=1 Tax=Nocardioides sp. CFH 31398 TaxID=2919579 RepID=UPI001F05EE75|nr:hemerythrin domain-containing protein [Nocardioides sp. CFH 31398]MCH1864941.1 hemerythrin domain-containing protein [Nocardioides sp. CFH 31398]